MIMLKKWIKRLIKILKGCKIIPIQQTIAAEKEFEGKVALIAGGSCGGGQVIVKSLIRSGCKVIIAGTNLEKLGD